ncbi:PTS sugar transporter subunit IIA [Devriesea agamarum]|uniref:PTS sugar transporter subunit IIA n=1 Tax=Devriesea agamarum TaxID=472569 RepID=UPI00082A7075|nr:PTS sugar transporter subunit IIA [Devriesea agamarum]
MLESNQIVLHGKAQDLTSAITEAGNLLVAAGAVEPPYVRSMIEREKTISTFIGGGLAIPHGTLESQEHIKRTAMSFVRYVNPIDWNGDAVSFVIGIAGQGDEHVSLLQRIAVAVDDPAQVARLQRASTTQEILNVLERNA